MPKKRRGDFNETAFQVVRESTGGGALNNWSLFLIFLRLSCDHRSGRQALKRQRAHICLELGHCQTPHSRYSRSQFF